MKNKPIANYTKPKNISNNSLMFGLVLVTVIFSFQTYDPFNSPKQWVLMVFASWLAGSLLVLKQRDYRFKILKWSFNLWALVLGFLIPQLISALRSQDLNTGLIGDVQRRNGFLTYFCLSVIFMFTVKFYDSANDGKFIVVIFGLSMILILYGFMQYLGRDFASWNNPYNPVILTLGNPNFAAALLGILGTFMFSFIFNKKIIWQIRGSSLLLFIVLVYVVYKSDSRQGLVNLLFAIGLFVGLLIFRNMSKFYGYCYFIVIGLIGTFALLGMLQKGPLQSWLYKDSVSIRGYYWRAAWEMFKEKPIFGVGTDQYGTYFKLFREVGYSLKYGYEITSTNAHNVFLQFFSTSGFLAGISYILIVLLIFAQSIQKIFKDGSNIDTFFLGLFSAWVAFQLQSVISIDNIALSIWGWVLGGVLLNKSNQAQQDLYFTKNAKSIQVLISAAILLPVVVFISRLAVSETSILRVVSVASLEGSAQNKQMLIEAARSVTAQKLTDGLYKQIAAEKMFISGFTNEALAAVGDLIKDYPTNPMYRASRAVMNANLGNYEAALQDRSVLLKLDPWNAENAFQSALINRNLGNINEMQKLKNYILSFVGEGEFMDKVVRELKAL